MKMFTVFVFALTFLFNSQISSQDFDEFLFNSTYDYLYNSSPHRHIEMIDLDNDGIVDPVIMLFGKSTEPGPYEIHLFYKETGSWNSIQPFPSGSGYRGMQYCTSGPLEGKILSMANHSSVSSFAIIDPEDWQVTTVSTGELFNSFVYLNDGSILVGRNIGIYKSTDQGSTFNHIFDIGDGDTNVDLSSAGESPIRISENGQHLSIVGAYDDAAASGVPDIVYNYFSNDFGATWQGEIIGRGSSSHPVFGQISNRDYAPYFTNFGQLSHQVDNDGKTHVVINGYGKGVIEGSSDTTDVFPVLYWNDNYDQWIAVSEPMTEKPDDGQGNFVINLYPGFGIGNAYPSLAITPNGKGIFIIWQSMEYSNELNTPFNIFPGDNSSVSTPVYYTDLMCILGYDETPQFGGITWLVNTNYLVGMSNSRTEQYPVLAPYIEGDGAFFAKTFFVYQFDDIPGVSLLPWEQNESSDETAWFYNTYAYQGTSVEDDISAVKQFNLEQNYPNPFNPATLIKYQIPDAGYVTLKVYDVLGSEVVTLVDEYKNAGSYEVEFNGNELTTGIYFYQLKSNNFVQTKKMILLK